MNSDLKDEYRQARFRCEKNTLPGAFFIVTAHNPDGITIDSEANERADGALRGEIERLGHEPFRVTGGNADFSHTEPGYGVGCSREEALDLAMQFRQEAVFEVRDGKVFLVSALKEAGADEEIGMWEELLEGS